MSADIVTLEVSDNIALVTLNRPPVNALDRAMRDRIVAVFDEISERADVRVAILTGAGKVFCSGADLKDRPDPSKVGAFHSHNRITRETGNCIRECAKPVIAAINGVALGAGVGLMASCDIFYACEEAVFGMPEINVGLAGGAAMLNTLFGRSLMRRMFFTGYRVPAAEPLPPRHHRGLHHQGKPDSGSDEDRARDRLEEPDRDGIRQERGEHGRADAPARCLSLRAEHHHGAVQDRGRQGGADRVPGEARTGVQGTLRCGRERVSTR